MIDAVENKRELGYFSATMIIIAAMIGTGIFTVTGYVIEYIPDPKHMIYAWIVVGFISLCGALSYAEISSVFYENGGEYLFLSKLIHPSVGFMSAWVSFIVGFSAPCAAAATAFGGYVSTILPYFSPVLSALAIVFYFSFVHIMGVKTGSYIQNILTVLKIVLVIVFIILGSAVATNVNIFTLDNVFSKSNTSNINILSSLLFISYAYTGWNTATYISGEIKNPKKNIPLAMITGTIIVSVFYVFVNIIYMQTLSNKEMEGVLEIGYITMRKLYGASVGNYFSIGTAIALASIISALIMAGSRLYDKVGSDYKLFKNISVKSSQNIPVAAILVQCFIIVVLIISMNFERLLYYIGFTLNIFSVLTVISVFVIRKKEMYSAFRVPLYPITPLVYIIFNIVVLFQTIICRPAESIIGFLTIFAGYILYCYAMKFEKKANDKLFGASQKVIP